MFPRRTSSLGFRLRIAIPLLLATAAAWYASAFLLHISSTTTDPSSVSGMPGMPGMPGLAMGVHSVLPVETMANMFGSANVETVSTFSLMWVAGNVAMMFPAMIPVVSFYSGILERRDKKTNGSRFGVPSFLSGYLALYALTGLLFFGLVYAAIQLTHNLPWLSVFSVTGAVAVLAMTGIWQLTPLKDRCLTKCSSPMSFFSTHGRRGPLGGFRMGAEHGIYCIGCCWMYMLVMVAVSAMSLFSMALLTGLIIVEKAFVGKTAWFKWLSASFFFSLAIFVTIFPSLLTTA